MLIGVEGEEENFYATDCFDYLYVGRFKIVLFNYRLLRRMHTFEYAHTQMRSRL